MGTYCPLWYSQYHTVVLMNRSNWKSEYIGRYWICVVCQNSSPVQKYQSLLNYSLMVLVTAKVRSTLEHRKVWYWLMQLSMTFQPITIDRHLTVMVYTDESLVHNIDNDISPGTSTPILITVKQVQSGLFYDWWSRQICMFHKVSHKVSTSPAN